MKHKNTEANIDVDKRILFKGAAALAGVSALSACSSLPAPASTHMSNSVSQQELEDRKVEIVRRLRYREDAGYLIWWFKGPIMAQKGADLIPLFNLVHCAIGQIEPRLDGGFDLLTVEVPFRTDLKTGKRLTRYLNPMTKEEIDIPYSLLGPTEVSFSADNELQLPEKIGGSDIEYKQINDAIYGVGDTLMYAHHARSHVQTPGKRDRIITEYSTLSAPLDIALDKSIKFAPAVVTASDVTDFARWLKTPPEHGNQSLRAVGQKLERPEDIPEEWMALVKEADPELYKNPLKALQRKEAIYKS